MADAGFRDYLGAVRDAADILQVVGETVNLKKAGRAWVGLCPFHQEKTPSFSVDPDKGLYYCFGCQRGGDVFRFVQELHHLEFAEAVRWLGERFNVPAPARRGRGHSSGRREKLLAALEAAQAFFRARLGRPDAEAARRLLQSRGLGDAAERFGLGFAPAGWEELLRHLTGRGHTVETLRDAGLVVDRQSGRGVYDRFRNRVTFPIRDTSGRIVSFGGRIVGEGEPKYLNGPETEVYDKGRTLFRLSEAAGEIHRTGRAVLVEGYFDALSLAAAGVPGVVALCGTALAEGHVRLLKRWASRVVLLFDGDDAGRRAATRALAPLLQAGLAVRAAFPPDGMDPDDFVRLRGAEAALRLIDAAPELPQFLVEQAGRSFDLRTVEGRAAALEQILQHLAAIPNAVTRADAASAVADAMHIDERALREELTRAARERRRRLGAAALDGARARRRLTEWEAVLVRYLADRALREPEAAATVLEELPEERLGPAARRLVAAWRAALASGSVPDLPELSRDLPEEDRAELLRLAFAEGPAPDGEQVRGVLRHLEEEELRGRLRSLQRLIEMEEDPQEVDRLLEEKVTLARRIAAMSGAGSTAARKC